MSMSRVHGQNKFVNTVRYDPSLTATSKVVRVHSENEDFHKAGTLSAWLFMKYDMSYITFRRKSLARRNELREEFFSDTGNRPDPVDFEDR